MSDPRAFNRAEAAAGRLTTAHVDVLIEEGARAVQQRAGLDVDGRAGPDTRAAVEALLRNVPSTIPAPAPEVRKPFAGKWVFARAPATLGDPRAFADRAAAAGLDGVSFLGLWQRKKGGDLAQQTIDQLGPFLEQLRGAGVERWAPWGWSYPGREVSFVDALVRLATIDPAFVADGTLSDPEALYNGRPLDVRRLVARQLEAQRARNLLAAGSTFGQIRFHARFPFRELAQLAGAGGVLVPQFYTHAADHPAMASDAVDAWVALGVPREQLLLGVGVFSLPPQETTPAELERILDMSVGTRGAIAWDWANARTARNAALWRVYSAWRPGR